MVSEGAQAGDANSYGRSPVVLHLRQSRPSDCIRTRDCPRWGKPCAGSGRVLLAVLLLVVAGAVPPRAEPAPSQPDDGHPYRRLRVRCRRVPRCQQPDVEPSGRRDGRDPVRERLLAGGLRRRHLRVRRRRASSARPAASRLNRPIVGMAAHADRQRLLAGGVRRRDLRLRRRRVLRLDRRHPAATGRSSGWRRRRRATATGWWRRTAGSSPSATRGSSARRAASTLEPARSSAWRRRRPAAATGWSRPTAASSPSATRRSSGRPVDSPLAQPIVGMAADADRQRLLAGRVRRRHLRVR